MNTKTYWIIREELLRGVAWFALSLLGWSIIYTSMEQSLFSAPLVFALTVATAVIFVLVMIGVRLLTGLELKAQTESSQLLQFVGGSAIGVFVVLYLILVRGRGLWLIGAYVVALGVGFSIWRWQR